MRADLLPHDLRHLANMLAARVPGTTTKDLMVRIGHASAQAALRYQHASEAADRAMGPSFTARSPLRPDAAVPVVAVPASRGWLRP